MGLKTKTSAHAVCIDPKKANGPKKPPNKGDLQDDLRMTKSDLKMTKQLNDALLEEVKESGVKIEALENKNSTKIVLEERVKNQTHEAHTFLQKDSNSIESQTESEFQEYPCNYCIYVASCLDELNLHQ